MADKNDHKGASGADDVKPGADDEINETDESTDASGDDDSKSVSRSAYLKTVSEAKRARERARKVAEENEALKAKLLEAEGNKDEKIKTLSQQLSEAKKREKQILGTTLKKALTSQVKAEAAKAGTIDADAVMSLLDLSDVEVDSETFEADGDLISAKIAELKKSKPYLFQKAGPKINGKMPTGESAGTKGAKSELSKMKTEDIWTALREMGKE